MGYTHYCKMGEVAPLAKRRKFCEAVQKYLKHLEPNVKLQYEEEYDHTGPVVSPDVILFNGHGDDAHEGFYLDLIAPSDFEFCKTARKPYDVAVAGVLTLAHHMLGVEVTSDGDLEDEEWANALDQLKTCFGVGYKLPLSR